MIESVGQNARMKREEGGEKKREVKREGKRREKLRGRGKEEREGGQRMGLSRERERRKNNKYLSFQTMVFVFHVLDSLHFSALTLFVHCRRSCQDCGRYQHKSKYIYRAEKRSCGTM